MNRGFRSRYISRYEKLNLGFLTFVVATIGAMTFFRRICSSRPAMGNSADRAWQLSQLVEGVLTACNPSHGSPRCFSRSPEARFRVFARAVRVSQPAVLSALLVIQLFGIVIPPPYFPKEHQKERCGREMAAALLHYVLWCASEYSVVGRISCYVSHDNTRTNVCQ